MCEEALNDVVNIKEELQHKILVASDDDGQGFLIIGDLIDNMTKRNSNTRIKTKDDYENCVEVLNLMKQVCEGRRN